jgi:hypothetical protein
VTLEFILRGFWGDILRDLAGGIPLNPDGLPALEGNPHSTPPLVRLQSISEMPVALNSSEETPAMRGARNGYCFSISMSGIFQLLSKSGFSGP